MKKRIFGLVLVTFLLCGCAVDDPDSAAETTEQVIEVTEPPGSYAPGSEVESRTGGAVRAYPLEISNCYAIAADGSDLLLFSGSETTALTKLSGGNLYTTAATQLDVPVYPEDPSFRITENGITYFDTNTREVVFLDNDLKEVNRIQTPKDMTGSPILSANRLKLYYCTADAVRVLDLETGLDKLLKEMSYDSQSLSDILLGDTVLYCSICDGEARKALFLSTETGSQLDLVADTLEITSNADSYFAKLPEGTMQALLFGKSGAEMQMLVPEDAFAECRYLPDIGAAVTVSEMENAIQLSCYDLASGTRIAGLELEVNCLWSMTEVDGLIYILTYNAETGGEIIYRWDASQTPAGDETVYTGPRYTLDNPDTEGLAECESCAQQLSETYSLEILTGTAATAVQPWDYDLQPEYQVPVIRRELKKLETLLANFPEGFFATLSDGTIDGPLKISLVRTITGSPESGSLDEANGVQFWEGEKAYVAVAAGDALEKTFYHELFHVIETRVFSECSTYYEWDSLNPEGFSYDYNYITNQDRDDSQYLSDGTRAFIDTYSMSYPKEDRARIMEYAATAGNESYFQSETMQAKLRTLCKGIREAFDLREYPNVLIWEQYLNKPLTP